MTSEPTTFRISDDSGNQLLERKGLRIALSEQEMADMLVNALHLKRDSVFVHWRYDDLSGGFHFTFTAPEEAAREEADSPTIVDCPADCLCKE